ncbi:unnamed protein product [Enterobius vermicularis]|uniref:MIF4G domain-containing protein n=1 Tax=Enterobius vermicularis TaxID=51028 RepID=A0A0N4UWV6_ENTVE|nr:unnamed protein product [Enterobius vermicularis]
MSENRKQQLQVDALGVLSGIPAEKLADHLHQRWLSDECFYRLPAMILAHLYRVDESDGTLMSCCLMHLLSDFRARDSIRKTSPLMFRNSVKVLAEMFSVYRNFDAVVSECLNVPLFVSLQMLADKTASEKDIQVLAEILSSHGILLSTVKPKLCDDLVIQVRNHLCDSNFTSTTRRLLLKINDLWTYNWELDSAPECILSFYGKTSKEPEEVEPKPQKRFQYMEQESVV